jgi:hypothetical protein
MSGDANQLRVAAFCLTEAASGLDWSAIPTSRDCQRGASDDNADNLKHSFTLRAHGNLD